MIAVIRNIMFLGGTSLFTDLSSHMILTLPALLYLKKIHSEGTPTIGLIEGIAQSTASLSRLPRTLILLSISPLWAPTAGPGRPLRPCRLIG